MPPTISPTKVALLLASPSCENVSTLLSAPIQTTARIALTALLSFLVYLVIGMQLAVMPVFVHVTLKFSPLIAGIAVSAQYVATLVTRPRAGTMSDTTGAKRTVMIGLAACIISGALLIPAALGERFPAIALAILFISRLFLGTGESLVATGQTLWGIGRVGHEHTPQVISWSGVMGYSAVAAGAPLGVWIGARYGMVVLAIVMTLIPLAGYAIANPSPKFLPSTASRTNFRICSSASSRTALRSRSRPSASAVSRRSPLCITPAATGPTPPLLSRSSEFSSWSRA